MIAVMEKLALYGLSEDRDRLLRGLMELGCAELRSPETLEEYEGLAALTKRSDLDIYELEQRLSRLGGAIAALLPHVPKPGLLAKRKRLSFEEYSAGDMVAKAADICDRLEAGGRELSELKAREAADRAAVEALSPWRELDMPLNVTGTARTDIRPIVYTGRGGNEEFENAIEQAGGAAVKISEDAAGAYYLVLSHVEDTDGVTAAMREFQWSRAPLSGYTGSAAENMARLTKDAEDSAKAQKEVEASIAAHAGDMDTLQGAYDATLLEIDCAKAGGRLMNTQSSFILTAWVPQKQKGRVEELLAGYSCCYELTRADQADPEMPVMLENPKWAEPFDSLTEMYAMPMPGSLDPGPFMAVFYFLFFGMMFSDAGYGLLMTVGCIVMLKLMDAGPGMKKMLKMLAACGVSTMIWGLVYGSFFGDAIPVVSESFFGKAVSLPIFIDPMKDPMTVLILSMALGLIHIMVGMGLSAYMMIKRGHPWAALFDVGFWFFVFIGLVMLLAGSMGADMIGAAAAGTVGNIGKWLAIAGAAGLVLTQGRDKKNIIGKIFGGVMSLYDITGYFSDVLSYSRILALGLATAVVASVMNIISTLAGPSVVGILLFIVVFTVGHVFNFGINALGSYVHAARLQYVEFFGKFYESGGKPFRPLMANTKYTAAVSACEEKE